jgi:uncharacterized protein (TIGR03437 family)
MRIGCGLVLVAQWVWAAGAPGFNYSLSDTTALVRAMAVDAAGNTYLTGSTASATFPTTPGVFQPAFGGGQCYQITPGGSSPVPCDDAFVVKLDPTGAIVWATYLGGSGNDSGSSIAVDAAGNVYVAGRTSPGTSPANQAAANNFPTTSGSLFPSPSATNDSGFVVKLSADGSQMIYGTYFPGVVAITVDSNGSAYVVTEANPAQQNFPTTAGTFQTSSSAGTAALIAKLNASGSALVYATYLGGTESGNVTYPRAIAVDSSGSAYVTGYADEHFPATSGAFQTAPGGQTTPGGGPFATKLNAAGSGLVYSTFLGIYEQGIAIKVDSQGRAYILGQLVCTGAGCLSTYSYFPTTPGAFEPANETLPAWADPSLGDQFLASLSADGSSLVYGTYISGALALDVDAAGDAYVAGFALGGFPVSAGAFEQCWSHSDFAAEFGPAGALVGATYYSGPSHVGGMAVAQNGVVSIGADASLANFLIDNPLQPDGPCMSLIVENAASYYSNAPTSEVAPGELVTLRGMGIGPEAGVLGSPGANGLLPTELAGVQVFFDEIAAPLMYVQSKQINVAVPWELAGRTTTQIQVIYNGVPANAASASVGQAAPGLFFLNYWSSQGAILNADGSINSASNPAKAGDVISLFGTGGGPTSRAGVTGGYWGSGANALLTSPVMVQMGPASSANPNRLNASVVYAGAAPGSLSTFFQSNVQVPTGLMPNPAADVYVSIGSVGNNSYQTPVTVAVQ